MKSTTISQIMNARHVSYSATLKADEQPDYCHEHAKANIPDALISQVKGKIYAVTSVVDGKTVLVDGLRLNKRNRIAIGARLQRFGAGLCELCDFPHPLSNLSLPDRDEEEETTTERVFH